MAKKLNYPFFVYDLGNLGFGEAYYVDNLKSTCLHKPNMIKKFLTQFTVYLDGDAFLINKIDEIIGDYDIGITVRRPTESEISKKFSWINAGVLFLNTTFPIDQWIKCTNELGDDQLGLSKLLNINEYVKRDFTINNIKVKVFPTEIYNFYYFPEKPVNAKILHLRGFQKELLLI